MAGIETMLRAMGIDPQKLMAQFSAQMEMVQEFVKAEFDALHDRLEMIEKRLSTIESEIQTLPDIHLIPPHHAAEMGLAPSPGTVLPHDVGRDRVPIPASRDGVPRVPIPASRDGVP